MASMAVAITQTSTVRSVSGARHAPLSATSPSSACPLRAGRLGVSKALTVAHRTDRSVGFSGRCNARNDFSDWEAELEEFEQDLSSFAPAPAARKPKGKKKSKKANKAMDLANMNMMEDAMYSDFDESPAPRKGKGKRAGKAKGRKNKTDMFEEVFDSVDDYEHGDKEYAGQAYSY